MSVPAAPDQPAGPFRTTPDPPRAADPDQPRTTAGPVPTTSRSGPAARPPGGPPAPPASPARRLLGPAAALAGVAAAFTYVGLVDPNESGHYPVCPLFAVTGLYCPGCGGLRGAHAFAHGDLAAALGANALAVLGYAIAAVLWGLWTVRSVTSTGKRSLPVPRHPAFWWGVGGAVVVFTVIRNLPFGSSLAP